ncbi:Hsp20/alpha crystallin family protein [Methanobacterium sp.]|uniref:Hsp20/alpha crystallin family protein n=1 Tax=Methanobacterium sp. TaxID=2164 RepID=UPI003C711DBB
MSFSEHVTEFSEHMAKKSHKNMKKTASEFFNVVNSISSDRRHRHKESTIITKKSLFKQILKTTTRTADNIKYNLEKSVEDYKSAPKNLIETDENIIVHLDMPGVKKEDIDLKITDSNLKVEACFDITQEIENGDITINNSTTGVFKRELQFPQKVVPKKAKATFENDVLTIEAPKVHKTKSFHVEIK